MAMNRSADPCKDFFQFACGTWNKKHLIPEDRSSISTFEVLADQLQIILKGTISILSSSPLLFFCCSCRYQILISTVFIIERLKDVTKELPCH